MIQIICDGCNFTNVNKYCISSSSILLQFADLDILNLQNLSCI